MLGPFAPAHRRKDSVHTDSAASEPVLMPRTTTEFLQRIQPARAALERTLSLLNEAQMVRPAPNGGWSITDHLAHLATRETGLATLLEKQPQYAAMGFDEATYLNTSLDGLHGIIYTRYKNCPLEVVLADFRQSHTRVLTALTKLTDADLLNTYSHYQPHDRANTMVHRSCSGS
jgi:hypothetical protein